MQTVDIFWHLADNYRHENSMFYVVAIEVGSCHENMVKRFKCWNRKKFFFHAIQKTGSILLDAECIMNSFSCKGKQLIYLQYENTNFELTKTKKQRTVQLTFCRNIVIHLLWFRWTAIKFQSNYFQSNRFFVVHSENVKNLVIF